MSQNVVNRHMFILRTSHLTPHVPYLMAMTENSLHSNGSSAVEVRLLSGRLGLFVVIDWWWYCWIVGFTLYTYICDYFCCALHRNTIAQEAFIEHWTSNNVCRQLSANSKALKIISVSKAFVTTMKTNYFIWYFNSYVRLFNSLWPWYLVYRLR